MTIKYFNDTKNTIHVYKDTLSFENKIAASQPLDLISFDVNVKEGEAVFIKMWDGVLLVSSAPKKL